MSKPDLFDRQFRRTARDMRRRPGPRTWDRIEQRLDKRGGSARRIGIRPWMIAAVVLIVAGLAALTQFPLQQPYDPLAQRAESVEELDSKPAVLPRIPDYRPLSEGRADGHLQSHSESRSRLTAAPKYRM